MIKNIKCGRNQKVTYINNEKGVFGSGIRDLYHYQCYVGEYEIEVENGDSVWYLDVDNNIVKVSKGPKRIHSKTLATVIRGYQSPEKSNSLVDSTNLPYVNGCSTRQLIHAERLGDPTCQLLQIPPGSKEQSHHIHSTARVVYVLSGRGWSVVGMEEKSEAVQLLPGMVAIFDPMTPHHFETEASSEEPLIAIPLHIFSSPGGVEYNHPMFNGTHLV